MSSDVAATDLDQITVFDLVEAVRLLPEDRPLLRPRIWYRSQKEHWIGWASSYTSEGGGSYTRRRGQRSARNLYNRIRNLEMLRWIAKAARVPLKDLRAAEDAATAAKKLGPARQASEFRGRVSWEVLVRAMRRRGIEIPGRRPIKSIRLDFIPVRRR